MSQVYASELETIVRILRVFSAMLVLLLLPGCVRLTMAWTDLTPDRPPASPEIVLPSNDTPDAITEWQTSSVPAIKEKLQRVVYGELPDWWDTKILKSRVIDDAYLGGRATLKEVDIEVEFWFGEGPARKAELTYVQVTPKGSAHPVPAIVMGTFCRNHNTVPHPAISRPQGGGGCDGGGPMSMAMTFVFGRYIATPPLQEIVDQGFALITFYPGDFVPDASEAGLSVLRELSPGHTDNDTRWGAIAAWAWGYSRVLDGLMMNDQQLDASRLSLYGHSRYGKAALLAAAFDERVAAVIAHQSGTGGASLSRSKQGESVKAITTEYPHWFSASYANFAGRENELLVDQHHLLALIAPRPMFLGNARRDVWSDPEGAFVAAVGADPVYEFLGSKGLEQIDLKEFNPAADISFFIRPGTHGVTEEDWPAFLEFLNAHFAR